MQKLYSLPSVLKVNRIGSWEKRVATSGDLIIGLLALAVTVAIGLMTVKLAGSSGTNVCLGTTVIAVWFFALMSASTAHHSIAKNNMRMRIRVALEYFKYNSNQLAILIPARAKARQKLPIQALDIHLFDTHPTAEGITQLEVQGYDGRKIMASFPNATFAEDGTIVFGNRVILHIPRVILAKALSLSKVEINHYHQALALDPKRNMMRSDVASRLFELSKITFYPCDQSLSPVENILRVRIGQHPTTPETEGVWVSFPESDYHAKDGALSRGDWATLYLSRQTMWYALEPEA